jgi:hypothetical protein
MAYMNFYVSPKIIRFIKSKRLKWMGHAARTGGKRNAYRFWSENWKGRDNSEDLRIDGKIKLEWILGK